MNMAGLGREKLAVLAAMFVILLVLIPQYYVAVAQPNLDRTLAVA
jgi:hypothetical protein